MPVVATASKVVAATGGRPSLYDELDAPCRCVYPTKCFCRKETMMATVGDRVELEATSDEYTRLSQGDRGTVVLIDSLGTVHVEWDEGSALGLVPGVDRFRVLEREAATP